MRERIRQLGGNLEISSNGSGTAVIARLPVREVSSIPVADVLPISSTSSTTAA
jgi:signal transduction histidine kinase